MKRLAGIFIFLILFSGVVYAQDFMIELKTHYLSPSEQAFKDIYGGGLMYGGEVDIDVWKDLSLWFGGSYFSKKGELTFTKEETTLKITPIGGGIRYSYPMSERMSIYGGVGLNYYQFKESNPIGEANKGGLGCIGKIGGYVSVFEGMLIDIYLDYSYCKMKPADYEINIGGIEAGIGIGYEF